MTFSVNLNNFRAFQETGDVKIAPITILTGMNSSGKSSFLGAVKYLSDIESYRAGGASFNKDPFYFGAFEQISNYMGGNSGQCDSFSIGFEGRLLEGRGLGRSGAKKGERVAFEITFSKSGPQPVIKAVQIAALNVKIWISIDYEKQTVTIEQRTDDGKEIFEMRNDMIPPDALFNNVSMVSFIYESILRRRISEPANQPTNYMSAISSGLFERAELIRNTLSSVPTTSFAGAPIRSRPSRTYDPTDNLPQAEGSHVPSQLAQLARQKPTEWKSIQTALNQFGEQSGLFKKIDVRALGKSESDPFQLEISINGPKRNIVDVGYGVSQVFPLLFEALTRRRGELMMIQQPEVHLHPEAQAALGSFLVDDIKKKPGYYMLETHSDYLIDRIRQKVRAGVIKKDDVSLLYFTQDRKSSHIASVTLNDDGDVVDPPKNYREFFLREELNTLGF